MSKIMWGGDIVCSTFYFTLVLTILKSIVFLTANKFMTIYNINISILKYIILIIMMK